MTAAQPQVRLLTIDEYAALGETDTGYTELLEGRVLVSPSPSADHNYAAWRWPCSSYRNCLAISTSSPTSTSTCSFLRLASPAGHADAGIRHYWIVDLDQPVALLTHHLAEDFGYADCAPATSVFTTTEPFPLQAQLDLLH